MAALRILHLPVRRESRQRAGSGGGGPDSRPLTERVKAAIAETGVRVTAVFIMYPGHVWDLVDGPRTIGLVPPDRRGA